MATKNIGRTLVQNGHTPYANQEMRRVRRVERQQMRVFCKKYTGPETESLIRGLRRKHRIWSWGDIHDHKWFGVLERYFVSRIGMSVDQAISELFDMYRSEGYKDRWVREKAQYLIERAQDGWNIDFEIDENGILSACD